MRNYIGLAFLFLLILSCQIEDDMAPAPQESFVKYYGELASYEAKDIEVILEGGEAIGLVVLGNVLTTAGDRDYFILLTDLDGNVINSRTLGQEVPVDGDVNDDGVVDEQDVVRGDEDAAQVEVTEDGFVIIGTTSITVDLPGISATDWKRMAIPFLSFNLEVDTTLFIRAALNSTELDLIGSDILELTDGSYLIVGSEEKFIDGSTETDFDSYFRKIGDRRNFIFEDNLGVNGIGEDEEVIRAFQKSNGNLVLIGSGNTTSSLGENNGDNGRNAFFIELDPNGIPVNSRYYGVDNEEDLANVQVYNDQVTSAIQTPTGFTIVGTSTTSQNEDYGFIININDAGVHLSSRSLPSFGFPPNVGGLQTQVNGLTQAIDNNLVLVGKYPDFNLGDQASSKSGEAMFMKVDLSSTAIENEEANYGLIDGNDEFIDAVSLPDGSIVVVGTIDFGAGTRLISIVKLNDQGRLVD